MGTSTVSSWNHGTLSGHSCSGSLSWCYLAGSLCAGTVFHQRKISKLNSGWNNHEPLSPGTGQHWPGLVVWHSLLPDSPLNQLRNYDQSPEIVMDKKPIWTESSQRWPTVSQNSPPPREPDPAKLGKVWPNASRPTNHPQWTSCSCPCLSAHVTMRPTQFKLATMARTSKSQGALEQDRL